MRHPNILGAIIAGGASSRFGSDKALALLDGQPLIAHAIAAVVPFVDRIVVCGREWGDLPSLADRPVAGLGPLGGIAAALGHAQAAGYAHVLTIGCDMPRAPVELIAALLRRAPAYCTDAPVLGHWPAALGAQLMAFLSGNDRSVRRWARSVGALPVASPVPLANVNTRADLDALTAHGDLVTP